MARKEICMEELVEVLSQWHNGRNIKQIKRSLGFDRKTIRKYLELAERQGFTRDMPLQPYEYYIQLSSKLLKEIKTPVDSSRAFRDTALYQSVIEKLLARKYMKPKQVYKVLKREHEYSLSYSSFNRYMNIRYPKVPRSCLRLEVQAGEEAQVDFGSAGMMFDPEIERTRRTHTFVMTLSYCRLPYVEFVFDQGQATWVRCHIQAFEFFNGVPRRIILDNLKSGILRPNTYDPVFNRAYAECARHYGFIIDPAKAARGDHKGKVERKIPSVRQQFLSSYDFKDVAEANVKVKDWCLKDYGMQAHGTIKRKPVEVFRAEEQPLLLALPEERFDIPLWKEAKVHPDHHIVFDKSYYSMPTRYVGKKLWVRGGMNKVQVFSEGDLLKTHQRSYIPGTWKTDEADYPPEKSKYLLKHTSHYQEQALRHGEHVCMVVGIIMAEHAYRNLRKVQALFRLADKYGSEALNLTCRRCLYYDTYQMRAIKTILEKQLYRLPLESEGAERSDVVYPRGQDFVRPFKCFIHTKEE
jgi:transposase